MSMGGPGLVFGMTSFSKIDKPEKKLIENEVLDKEEKSS